MKGAPEHRRRRWRRWLWRGFGRSLVVGFVVLLGFEGSWLLRAHQLRNEADQVDERMASLTADIRAQQLALARTQGDLDEARRALDARARASALAMGARGSAQADRDTAASELARLQAEVERLQGEIAAAHTWTDINRLTIAGLDTCLNGVARFLNQVSVGDSRGAVATAQSVSGTCAELGVPVQAASVG